MAKLNIEITAEDTAAAELSRAVKAMRKAQPFTRKAARVFRLGWYYTVNALFFLFGYRWLDARYGIEQDVYVYSATKDISYTTAKAIISRRAKKSKLGLALRLKAEKDDGEIIRIIAGDDGRPIYYWQFAWLSWETKA